MRRTFRAGGYRPDPARDVEEEIQAHLEEEVEGFMSQGMDRDEAWRKARALMGDLHRHAREARRHASARERTARWLDRFDSLAQDVRYALRRMAKNPGFTAVAVLSMALGIGANTAVFSIVNAILLGGVPMQAPEELVEIYTSEKNHGYPYSLSSVPDLMDLRERTDLFAGVGGYEAFISRYETDEATEPVLGELVTHDLFDILGIQPALGRDFVAEEGQTRGTHPVVVLGHSFWRSHFGGDPGVLGRSIRLGGTAFTVVGVAPEELQALTAPGFTMDLWAPYQMAGALSLDGDGYEFDSRGSQSTFIRARLRPDVTVEEARAALATMSAQHQAAYPDAWKGQEFNVLPTSDVSIHPMVDGPLKGVAALLLSAVALVLLIACVNLAGFLLARALDRRKEIALRLALGARRSALVRQLLVETLALGLVGGAAGLLVAHGFLSALVSFQPPIPFPLNLRFTLDGRVLLLTGMVSVAAGLFLGLMPALQSTKPDLAPTLKEGAGAVTGSRRRITLRNALLVTQVAISTVLLLGAGLFLRSLTSAQSMDLGFSARDGAVAWVLVSVIGTDAEETEGIIRTLEERALSIPGVERVATAEMLPLGVGLQTTNWDIPGVEPPPGEEYQTLRYNKVSGTYFEVMGIPMVEGRTFTPEDRAGSQPVAIVSEATARRYWPGESAIGKEIRRGRQGTPHRIVGVARDTKVWTLGEEYQPYVYLARPQTTPAGAQIIARGTIPDAQIASQLRRMIREVDPRLVIMETKTIPEHLSIQLFPPRAAAVLLGAFGFLALVLATTGLYGTVAFSVSRRTREMGIRLSMGASAGQVEGMVLMAAMGPVALGASLGWLVGLGLAQAIRGFMYGVSAVDPVTFLGVPAILGAVALAAALVPARRASGVDPVQALRAE